ncbi:hypothetical protein GCM10022383_00340 [Microbacterium soli]|uniref:Uncharacterized protein n=1 Tax=Microbacterium soli TaxID=446075 RepID=A0ABP7MK22_9MICO
MRVFARFTALDAVSGGRAEIVAERGPFIESFPLAFDLNQYEELLHRFVRLGAAWHT